MSNQYAVSRQDSSSFRPDLAPDSKDGEFDSVSWHRWEQRRDLWKAVFIQAAGRMPEGDATQYADQAIYSFTKRFQGFVSMPDPMRGG